LISDKIKGSDSKRKVVCIHFGHPMKKTALVRALHGRAAMAGVGAPWPAMGELTGKERVGEGEGRGEGGHGWGARRTERRKRKGMKRKEKRKIYGKFSKVENFQGEKEKTIYDVGKN
jgi:hypothetical protein